MERTYSFYMETAKEVSIRISAMESPQQIEEYLALKNTEPVLWFLEITYWFFVFIVWYYINTVLVM